MADGAPITVISQEVHPHGGQERAQYELILRLLEHGMAVTVVARRCDISPTDGLRWVRVRGPTRPFPLAYIWFLVVGTILVLIHGTGIRQSVGVNTLNRLDVVAVHCCHNEYSRTPASERRSRESPLYTLNAHLSSALSLLAERWCYRPSRVRKLAAVSNGVAEELRRHYPRMATRVTVIPNGVDRNEFRPDREARARTRSAVGVAENDLVAVFVGGAWERKGLRIALAGVGATDRWHLVVAGRGDASALEDFAREHGVEDRLHIWGMTARPNEVYAAGDAFVLPSSHESFSISSLEAAASGLPLLLTRVNGADELIREGETGWFVDRTPESVCRGLQALAADPKLRQRMGQRARLVTGKYGWDRVTRMYESIFGEELAPRSVLDTCRGRSGSG